MFSPPSSTLRPATFFIFAVLAVCAAQAQTPAPEPTPQQPPTAGRPDQRIENIHTEDSDTRIDEVRVGGQTQSITVTPKSDMPPYHIQPTSGVRTRPTQREGAESGNGPRVWSVHTF